MPSYIATYIVSGKEINNTTDGTQTLSSVIGKKAYLYVSTSGSNAVIDLAMYMLREKSLNYTTQLTAVASSLTDLQIASYESEDIPFVDQVSGGFDNRLAAYDAYITSDVNVSWCSIDSPDVRDDIYQKDQSNDLVISSTTKDFSNALVAVNGVFHKTYFFNKELYVQGGFSNIKTAKQNKVAIYDTTTLGGHLVVPITQANIDPSNNAPFSGVTLTFPNIDFTGMTVLLVLGGYLYALDDTYQLINTNRLRIDTCKIDLIDQFLHDPNTSYVKDNISVVVSDTSGPPPSVENEIAYYLQSVYPNAIANVSTAVNFISFNLFSDYVSPILTPADEITNFLSSWPITAPNGASVMFAQYEKYMPPTSVINGISPSDFTDPRWVYALLTQPNSFLIAIKNSTVYKRTYELSRTQIPGQYVCYSAGDTPRGILQYDKNRSLPYLVSAESNNLNYNFSIDYEKINRDAYKTAISPATIPSPSVDVRDDINYPVRLLELYAPSPLNGS